MCLPRHDCSLHTSFLHPRFQHCHSTQLLFAYHDCGHPNCSGTIYIKSPKTPNLFLEIYPKEIIGHVPKRCMYKVFTTVFFTEAEDCKHINLSFVACGAGLQNLIYTYYNFILPPNAKNRLYMTFG